MYVGALGDVLTDIRWEGVVAHDTIDQGVYLALCEPVDGERRRRRLSDPGRIEFFLERHNQQHTADPDPVHDPTK
jgi:hypothetical protein